MYSSPVLFDLQTKECDDLMTSFLLCFHIEGTLNLVWYTPLCVCVCVLSVCVFMCVFHGVQAAVMLVELSCGP